jgi:hypothetical protein
MAAALLIQPDDQAAAVSRDHRLGERHLLATITVQTVEDMSGQTLRVHATQNIVPLFHLTHDQGDTLLVPVVIEEFPKRAQ